MSSSSSDEGARGELFRAVTALREARRLGKLRAACSALDRALELAPAGDARALRALADEGVALGQALEAKDAPLAALSEHMRALDLVPGHPLAREGVARGFHAYPGWRPPLAPLAPRDQLHAGATGAFWLARDGKARLLVLKGGITSETVEPARAALQRASEGVRWLFVDMKELRYMGSPGIAAAVKAAEFLERSGGGLVLFSIASNLALVIDTLGLAKHLPTAPDLAGALAFIRQGRGSSVESAIAPPRATDAVEG